jgi:hypothetical protein
MHLVAIEDKPSWRDAMQSSYRPSWYDPCNFAPVAGRTVRAIRNNSAVASSENTTS